VLAALWVVVSLGAACGGTKNQGGTGGAGGSGGGGGRGGTGGSGGGGAGGAGGGGGKVDAAPVADAPSTPRDGGGGPDGPGPDGRPMVSMSPVFAPWTGTDIGPVGMPGTSGRTRSQFQVRGSGGDIWAEADQFQFLHQNVTGDFEMAARLVSIERTNENAKAGLMIRDSLLPDARNAFMMVFPTSAPTAPGAYPMGKGSRLQFRAKTSDNLTGFADLISLNTAMSDAAPIWLRMTRKGDLLTGFISADGDTWLRDGEIRLMGLPAEVPAGLAVTSHANNNGNLAAFENLRITALTDANFAHEEVGTLGGFASGAPRRFNLVNAGRGIANGADGITFVHQLVQQEKDVEITVKVSALSVPANRTAKVGLALRGALTPGARMVTFLLELSANNGQRYRLQRRAQDNGDVDTTDQPRPPAPDGGAGDAADAAPDTSPDTAVADAAATDGSTDGGVPLLTLHPITLKLVRAGNRFVGFISENGTTFEPVIDLPSFVIAMNGFAGVFLTSGNEGQAVSATLENLTIGPPVTPLPVRPDAAPPGDDAGTDAAPGN
jgi:hypothetical protein